MFGWLVVFGFFFSPKPFQFTKLRLGCENPSMLYLPITPSPEKERFAAYANNTVWCRQEPQALWQLHSPNR